MLHKPPAEVVHVVEPFVAAVIEPIFYSDATRSWASHRVAGDPGLGEIRVGAFFSQAIAARLLQRQVLGRADLP